MINFANFKSNSQSNSNFIETVSLEEMKSACNGASINVVPSKEKTHASGATMCFFACGQVRGMVAEKLSDKMLNGKEYGTPVVSEVVMQDGNHMLIMHEQGNNNDAIVSF
jgi:hypothetical protein|nr:MAG: hypothetical protein [Bacteriophage sp.]